MTGSPPKQPSRFLGFARFFKRYMSVWAIVTASLPIPVTLAGFIPTYSAQAKALSVYATLFCFLLLAVIFYARHPLAKHFFHIVSSSSGQIRRTTHWFVPALPFLLIVLCMGSAAGYQTLIRRSIWDARAVRGAVAGGYASARAHERIEAGDRSILLTDSIRALFLQELDKFGGPDTRSAKEILKETDLTRIPFGGWLAILYTVIFVSAEAAFILMAMKEYLQDVLGIPEKELFASD